MPIESEHRQTQTIRVMIVENHQLILWGLNKLINEQRPFMEVAGIACNTADAISRAAHATPDVVLLKFELARLVGMGELFALLDRTGGRTLILVDDLTVEALQISVRTGAHGLLTRKSRAEEVVKAIEKTFYGELWFGREVTGMALESMREPKSRVEAGKSPFDLLTPRERKVLRAVMESKVRTNKDLARELFISESTLRNHLSSIYQKFGVTNRLDLYVYAQDHGIGFDLTGVPG
jgi:DNA-binding NarL/FixJ family response regulator